MLRIDMQRCMQIKSPNERSKLGVGRKGYIRKKNLINVTRVYYFPNDTQSRSRTDTIP